MCVICRRISTLDRAVFVVVVVVVVVVVAMQFKPSKSVPHIAAPFRAPNFRAVPEVGNPFVVYSSFRDQLLDDGLLRISSWIMMGATHHLKGWL